MHILGSAEHYQIIHILVNCRSAEYYQIIHILINSESAEHYQIMHILLNCGSAEHYQIIHILVNCGSAEYYQIILTFVNSGLANHYWSIPTFASHVLTPHRLLVSLFWHGLHENCHLLQSGVNIFSYIYIHYCQCPLIDFKHQTHHAVSFFQFCGRFIPGWGHAGQNKAKSPLPGVLSFSHLRHNNIFPVDRIWILPWKINK